LNEANGKKILHFIQHYYYFKNHLMKKLLLLISLFFSIHCLVTAQNNRASNSSCGWEAWFDNYCGKTYTAGKDLKVQVRAKNHHRIKYMELYINGDYVGKETSHPYDWGKQGKDKHLKNMRKGTYRMEVKIVDHCGRTNYIKHCEYYVKGHDPCNYHDLHWIEDIKRKHHGHSICEYTYNGHKYYRVYPSGVSVYTEYWYDCEGHQVCKFDNSRNGYPCNIARNAKKVKCWYEPNPPTCNYHDLHWIKDIKRKYPDHYICEYHYNGKTYYQVYPCGKSHYTEYWFDCDGHQVCKFENGRPCSTVKYAKKVKCWYEPHCPTGPHGDCHFDKWFDKPKKQNHRWYVKLNVSKHRDIKYVDLYVNGKHAGKEDTYPYDWGKQGKDNYLKNLHRGTYKLHAKIYTTCGHVVEKHHEFRVY